MEDIRIGRESVQSGAAIACETTPGRTLLPANPDRVAATFESFADAGRGIAIAVRNKDGLFRVFSETALAAEQKGISFSLNIRDHFGIVTLEIVGMGLTQTETINVVESVLPRR